MSDTVEVNISKVVSLAAEFSMTHSSAEVIKILGRHMVSEFKLSSVYISVREIAENGAPWMIRSIGQADLPCDVVKSAMTYFDGPSPSPSFHQDKFTAFSLMSQSEFFGVMIIKDEENFFAWDALAKFLFKSFLKLASEAVRGCRGVESVVNRGIKNAVEQGTARIELVNTELKKSSQNQADFLSHMSHELRTPLNAILGITSLLREDFSGTAESEKIEVLHNAGEGMLELINDILDISKMAEGEIKLVEQPFRLDHVLREVAQIIQPKVADAVKLELDYSAMKVLNLVGDSFRLRQILINLLGNAAKFTRKGRITLSVFNGDNEGRVLFSIADTGPGIPDNRKKLVFEKFKQAEQESALSFGGAGLGLSICQSLVALMSGSIWVEDNDAAQSGSKFMFDVQLGTKHLMSKNVISNFEKEAVSDMFLKTNLKILVVEDSPENIFLIKAYFKKTKFSIDYAIDGQLGVVQFQKDCYDLVLMDLQMPVLDGYGAIHAIRNYELTRGLNPTPVIALTANALDSDLKKIIESGFDFRLTKPIKCNDLLRSIQRTVSLNKTSP